MSKRWALNIIASALLLLAFLPLLHSKNTTTIEQGIQSYLQQLLSQSQAGCTEFTLGSQDKNNLKINPMLSALANHNELIINIDHDDKNKINIALAPHHQQKFTDLGNNQRQFCYAAIKLAGFNFYKAPKENRYHVNYDYDLIPLNSAFVVAAKKMGPLHVTNNRIDLKKTANGFQLSSKLWNNN